MKLLITGIHGFVGSNLATRLGDKYEIFGLDVISPDKKGVVATFSWDDLDEAKLPDVDMIIHLAAIVHDIDAKTGADDCRKINVGLTQKIYDRFRQSNASKFLFFSSVAAAADSFPDGILTEDAVAAPVGPYGESKKMAEDYILGNPPADKKKVYIFRPCMIHGPGNKGNLNLLFDVVAKGFPWPLGAFENQRTFVSIDNLAYIVDRLAQGDAPGGIYNIADDDPVSTNRLVELICEARHTRPRILKLPKRLMTAVGAMGDALHLPLNKARLRKLTENYVASNAKIKKALGIDSLPVKAEDGLRSTIKSLLSR